MKSYINKLVNKSAKTLACLLALACQSHAATFVSGGVSGTWYKTNSPYVVSGNITVPSGQILTIQPGVTVIIGQGLNIACEGAISAIGTAALPKQPSSDNQQQQNAQISQSLHYLA